MLSRYQAIQKEHERKKKKTKSYQVSPCFSVASFWITGKPFLVHHELQTIWVWMCCDESSRPSVWLDAEMLRLARLVFGVSVRCFQGWADCGALAWEWLPGRWAVKGHASWQHTFGSWSRPLPVPPSCFLANRRGAAFLRHDVSASPWPQHNGASWVNVNLYSLLIVSLWCIPW